jgi:hypothetical protein
MSSYFPASLLVAKDQATAAVTKLKVLKAFISLA